MNWPKCDRSFARAYGMRSIGPFAPLSFHPCDDLGCGDVQRIADPQEHVHRRRLVVVLQLAQVGPVDACRECQLLLADSRFMSCIPYFVTQHSINIAAPPLTVCRL